MKFNKSKVMAMAWKNYKGGPSSVIGNFPRSLKRAWLFYRNSQYSICHISAEDDQAISQAILSTWNNKLF